MIRVRYEVIGIWDNSVYRYWYYCLLVQFFINKTIKQNTSCAPQEVCVLNENSTAVCEKVVTDPCEKCTATQKCSINSKGTATCQEISSCTLARRKLNLDDCIPPALCVVNSESYPMCKQPKPEPCDAICKKNGTVCGPDGLCVKDKCADFSWPPAGVEFCDVNKKCSNGMKCTGCTVSGSCDSQTGEKTFGHDCRPTCETFSLNCNATNLTREEKKTCCSVEGVGCESYDCTSDEPVEEWSADQRTYCCKEFSRGCKNQPGVKFDCFDTNDVEKWTHEKKVWCCSSPRSIGCPVIGFDCTGSNSTWSSKQSEYCCREFGKSCTPSNGFDCTWNNKTTAPWSDVQKNWCCAHNGVRCPPKEPFTCNGADPGSLPADEQRWCCANKRLSCRFKCQQNKDIRDKWSANQREYCCLYDGVSCKSNTQDFDCFNTSAAFHWSEPRKQFCCLEKDVGCPVDCTAAKVLLTQVQMDDCCKGSGLHCDASSLFPPVPPGGERKTFRFTFREDWNVFSRNPKRMVRKFRMSLLAASKTLQSSPSVLEVNYIGALMSGNEVPSTSRLPSWGTNALLEWNTDSAIPDVVKNASDTTSRSVAVLSETMNEAVNSKDGAHIDYYLTGSIEIVDQIQKEIDAQVKAGSGRKPNGVFQKNLEGYSLILSDPMNNLIQTKSAPGTETPSPSSSSSKSWIWILIASIGGTCLIGGLVVLYLKRRRPYENYVDNLEMHEGLDIEDELILNTHDYDKCSVNDDLINDDLVTDGNV